MARKTPWNPNTAAWLVAQRGKRKQDDVVADLRARGVEITRAWLSRIENGQPFSAELLEAVQDYYGSVPPPYEPPAQEQPASTDLVAAIDRQTAAIEAQTRMLELVLSRLGGLPLDEADDDDAVIDRTDAAHRPPRLVPDPVGV